MWERKREHERPHITQKTINTTFSFSFSVGPSIHFIWHASTSIHHISPRWDEIGHRSIPYHFLQSSCISFSVHFQSGLLFFGHLLLFISLTMPCVHLSNWWLSSIVRYGPISRSHSFHSRSVNFCSSILVYYWIIVDDDNLKTVSIHG